MSALPPSSGPSSPPSSSPPGPTRDACSAQPDQDRDARDTYRYLRVAPLVVLGFLGASLVIEWSRMDCGETSISAFYYTATHAVFVAALCAIGVCLIVYRGNSALEDVVLNISGFLAFLVAVVPTYEQTPATCAGPGTAVILPQDVVIGNNLWAVAIAAVAAEAIRWFVIGRGDDPEYRTFWVLVFGLVGYGLVVFLLFKAKTDFPWIRVHGHDWAAISMFGGIILVMLRNAVGAFRATGRPWAAGYGAAALVMIAGLVVVAFLKPSAAGVDKRVFWAEVVVIGAFGAFWLMQTIELWRFRDRDAKTRSLVR